MGRFKSAIIIIGMLLSAANQPRVDARPPDPADNQAAVPGTDSEYRLVWEMPTPDSLTLLAGRSPSRARHAAAAWAQQQALPALAALRGMQAQGEVAAFGFDPLALEAWVKPAAESAEVLERLRELPNVAQVLPGGAPTGYRQALTAQFLSLVSPAKAKADRPDFVYPTIWVYAQEGNPRTFVQGRTESGDTLVALSARRGTTLLFARTVTSDPLGYYSLYPEGSYPYYAWQLLPGDVVTVLADGVQTSTTVARLTGWIDPQLDAVQGFTEPGRSVLAIYERELPGDPCEEPLYDDPDIQGGVSAEDGSFLIDFSSIQDFLYGAAGFVEVLDPSGNYTWALAQGFGLELNRTRNHAFIYLLPNAEVEVTLSRQATVLETLESESEYDGWLFAFFENLIQPGDVITAASEAATLVYQVAPLELEANPDNEWVTGVTSPYGTVIFHSTKPGLDAYLQYAFPFPMACSTQDDCLSTTASELGEFALLNPFDLGRGDALEARVEEASGFVQIRQAHVPLISARPAQREILGYWRAGNVPVVVEVTDDLGTLVHHQLIEPSSNGYYKISSVPLAPGYQVTAQDAITTTLPAIVTLTLEVPALTANADSATDQLTGAAPASHLMLLYQDFLAETEKAVQTCYEQSVALGDYAFNLSGAGIEAADEGTVYSRGADGHITAAYSHAFQMNLEIQSGTLSGFTPLPGTDMILTHFDSAGTKLEEATRTSSETGTYNHTFLNHPLLTGQRVLVELEEGSAAELILPPVSLLFDEAQEAIYGKSGALRPGMVSLLQFYACDGSCVRSKTKAFTADGAGDYLVSFAGLTWTDGTPVEVCAQCTASRLHYYTLEEHRVALHQPDPAPAPADAYEDDGSDLLAQPYQVFSQHTFHDSLDTDWVLLEVTSADLGKTFVIETTNLGLMMDTWLWLYDDKLDELANDDDSGAGSGSRIVFTPERAGEYYIQVTPKNTVENTGNCGATYDLVVTTNALYMPLITR